MSAQWLALLGMSGASLVTIVTASAFVISKAVDFGRFMQRFEVIEERVDRHSARISRLEHGEREPREDYQ